MDSCARLSSFEAAENWFDAAGRSGVPGSAPVAFVVEVHV
jgi:hypothetical protein